MGLDSNVKLGLIGGLVKGFRVKKGVMGGAVDDSSGEHLGCSFDDFYYGRNSPV